VPSPASVAWANSRRIGNLGQVEVDQIVDQVCYMGGAGSMGHGRKLQNRENGNFVSAITLLLVRGIISSKNKPFMRSRTVLSKNVVLA